MPLGGFGLLSLFYIVMGARFATEFWPQRRAIFDNRLTHHDRTMITQAAFFFLLPVSVALHELGHAIAIWLFGGEVVDFGFYFFAGFVSYDPTDFSDVQQMVVASAGSLVNVLLIALAMGIVLFKSPPLRPAYNELLLQFSVISGINALIVYPLIDLASGLSGDWSQMYDGGVPWLTAIIVAVQFIVIGLGVWISRSPAHRATLAKKTGVQRPEDRTLLSWTGSSRPVQSRDVRSSQPNEIEQLFSNAAARVASGWRIPLHGRLSRSAEGSELTLEWNDRETSRIVFLTADKHDQVAISGGTVQRPGNGFGPPPRTRASWNMAPSEDELTLALRVAMESIDRE